MPKIPMHLCNVIVCMSARKKAPVNLLMCPFELYMFIGVSMQLRVVFKYDFLVLIPYCWSVALEKKKKKKNVSFYWKKIKRNFKNNLDVFFKMASHIVGCPRMWQNDRESKKPLYWRWEMTENVYDFYDIHVFNDIHVNSNYY